MIYSLTKLLMELFMEKIKSDSAKLHVDPLANWHANILHVGI
jgi:hypothetical protein